MPRGAGALPLALPVVLASLALAAGCREEGGSPPASAPAPVTRGPKLQKGLRLTLVPNIPGVVAEDLPLATRREVEVLAYGGGRLRLRWSGRVRRETGASARRREEWVRRVAASPDAPGTPPPAAYEEARIGGTLELPDFAEATSLLLPGLWPEGTCTVRGTSAIWLPPRAREQLLAEASSRLALAPEFPLLLEPAASLLTRSAIAARESDPPRDPTLIVAGPSGQVRLDVNGSRTLLPSFEARSYLGRLDVLVDADNPLVTALLPEPGPSAFVPARVLTGLLGYRVSAVRSPR